MKPLHPGMLSLLRLLRIFISAPFCFSSIHQAFLSASLQHAHNNPFYWWGNWGRESCSNSHRRYWSQDLHPDTEALHSQLLCYLPFSRDPEFPSASFLMPDYRIPPFQSLLPDSGPSGPEVDSLKARTTEFCRQHFQGVGGLPGEGDLCPPPAEQWATGALKPSIHTQGRGPLVVWATVKGSVCWHHPMILSRLQEQRQRGSIEAQKEMFSLRENSGCLCGGREDLT